MANKERDWAPIAEHPRDERPFLVGRAGDEDWLAVVRWSEEEGQFVAMPDLFFSKEAFTHWAPIPPLESGRDKNGLRGTRSRNASRNGAE